MKWYFCMNEGPWQFEMAQVAIHTAKANTKLEPVCVYDGRDKKVIEWMEQQQIPVIFHRNALYNKACKVYEVEPGTPRANKAAGAWARIDLPLLTDEEFILYADTDILFLGDCQELETVKPEYIAACSDYNPLNNYNINSGVMIMNIKNLREEYNEFTEWITGNMLKIWSTYDQTAYDQYYWHRKLHLPIEYNWKSFWEDDYAVWHPRIRVPRSRPVQILHFTGTKPWDRTRYKEGMGLYRGANNYPWQKKWLDVYEQVKLPDEKEIVPVIKHNVLYPYHTFLHLPLIDNPVTLEDLLVDFGVNTTDTPKEYPEHIRFRSTKMDMRIWQQPNQLAAFLSWIYEHKKEINNYTEIGTAYGGTFYVIDSYLRAVNPNFTYSTGVDCMPRLVDFHFYQDKFPETEIVQSLSLDYAPVGTIDLCFIDTVHTYEYTMAEYEYYKKFCKYIAFHDIEGFPAMQRFWKEIKGKHQSWEFTQQYNNRVSMGIGVIKV